MPSRILRVKKWIVVCFCLFPILIAGCKGEALGPNGAATTTKASAVKIATVGLQEDQFYRLIDLGMKDAAGKHAK